MMMIMMINSEMWSTSGEKKISVQRIRVGSSAAGHAGEVVMAPSKVLLTRHQSLCLHHQPREKKKMRAFAGVALEASPDSSIVVFIVVGGCEARRIVAKEPAIFDVGFVYR